MCYVISIIILLHFIQTSIRKRIFQFITFITAICNNKFKIYDLIILVFYQIQRASINNKFRLIFQDHIHTTHDCAKMTLHFFYAIIYEE